MIGKDITGQVFGTMTVIKKLKEKKGTSFLWEVICSCGNTKNYTANELKHLKSCGCQHYNKKPKDISNKKFGRLTALVNTGYKGNNGDYIWKCLCDCGGTVEVSIGNLNCGKTKSCGCLVKDAAKQKDNYHGMTESLTYKSWLKMLERCRQPNCIEYENYGAKGIDCCDEWLDYRKFYSDLGERPSKDYSLDRIDGTKGYFKGNCRWATKYAQNRNKNSYTGTSKYKGVQYEESSDKWIATFSLGKYKSKKIGRYSVEEHAAVAYNYVTKAVFGEESSLIVLNETTCDDSVVNTNCKFFRHWLPLIIEERKAKYEDD